MGARVIGIGGRAAGDDGVGPAVVDALRAAPLAAGIELVTIAEPTALVDLLEGPGLVVLVDAVADAGAAGEVVVLPGSALAEHRARPLSSHGVGLADALALARVIHGGAALRVVWIVGVCVGRVERGVVGLSPEVAAAVPRAVEAVVGCLRRGDADADADANADAEANANANA